MTPILKKLAVVLVAIIILGGLYFFLDRFYLSDAQNDLAFGGDNATATSTEALQQQANIIKQMSKSPIAVSTRQIFNLLMATSSKTRANMLTKAPFGKDIDKVLTDEKLQSKFIVVGGNEIPYVGAQLFLLFPAQPDAIFRAGYQLTQSTTTPIVLVNFEKTEDTAENVQKFITAITPYLNEPDLGQ